MISPSLQTAERAAYELKFALDDELRPRIAAWATDKLRADVYGDAEGRYAVRTLYYDTAALDMFHRNPGYRAAKYRVRQYGEFELRYFERKRKRGSRVRKIRDSGEQAPRWFEDERCAKNLDPVLWVEYQRAAFMADGLRLTMDSDLKAWPSVATDRPQEAVVKPGAFVLELKFSEALPSAFRQLIMDHRLVPTTCSKYRWAMSLLQESGCLSF